MLISEICKLLNWKPATASKRMTAYYQESGKIKDDSPFYDDATFADLKRANEVFLSGEAETFREAVRIVLGKHHTAIPPESVQAIENELKSLKQQIEELKSMIEQVFTADSTSLFYRTEQLLSRIDSALTQPANRQPSDY